MTSGIKNFQPMPPVTVATAQKAEATKTTDTPVKFEIAKPVEPTKATKETVSPEAESFYKPSNDGPVTVTIALNSFGDEVGRMPARKIVEAYTAPEKKD